MQMQWYEVFNPVNGSTILFVPFFEWLAHYLSRLIKADYLPYPE